MNHLVLFVKEVVSDPLQQALFAAVLGGVFILIVSFLVKKASWLTEILTGDLDN